MLKHTRNLNFLVLVLLAMAFLLAAANPNFPSVKAQTQVSVYVYLPLGGTITENGAPIAGGTTYNFTSGTGVTFNATPNTGFRFVAWEYCTPPSGGTGVATTTDNPFVYNISTTSCSIMAIFVPTESTVTASTTSSTVPPHNDTATLTQAVVGLIILAIVLIALTAYAYMKYVKASKK